MLNITLVVEPALPSLAGLIKTKTQLLAGFVVFVAKERKPLELGLLSSRIQLTQVTLVLEPILPSLVVFILKHLKLGFNRVSWVS